MRLFRQWGWEATVFRGATAVALVHALDDAFLNRQPGVPLDQHALAAAISLAAGVGAIVAFPRLRPGFRAAITLVHFPIWVLTSILGGGLDHPWWLWVAVPPGIVLGGLGWLLVER